ncbi:hypothetical protein AC578_4857 [Pseudocercospora eumusae]|uniref:Ketoreductase (KR) domain-containing protein n=1 Tax=Pseudocercospora eumusae TaxID=321146 RepID=A0A139HC45_9PEZI|nr:hypothetical protein AC578_4857 [Pseudocercospora eumusae]
MMESEAAPTVVLITGANTGLGFETVKALLQSPRKYTILLGGRDVAKAERAANAAASEIPSHSIVQHFQIDVEDDSSIAKAYENIAAKYTTIDCIINNAGASFDSCIEKGTMTPREAWSKTWDVNVTGAHIVTTTFLPLLLRSRDPRLLFITSGLSSLGENSKGDPRYPPPPAGLPKKPSMFMAYRSAKAGLNMMMLEWTRMLKNDGVKVWALAPGLLATGLGDDVEVLKKLGAVEPSVGGNVVRSVVEGARDSDSGMAIREYKSPIQPW